MRARPGRTGSARRPRPRSGPYRRADARSRRRSTSEVVPRRRWHHRGAVAQEVVQPLLDGMELRALPVEEVGGDLAHLALHLVVAVVEVVLLGVLDHRAGDATSAAANLLRFS